MTSSRRRSGGSKPEKTKVTVDVKHGSRKNPSITSVSHPPGGKLSVNIGKNRVEVEYLHGSSDEEDEDNEDASEEEVVVEEEEVEETTKMPQVKNAKSWQSQDVLRKILRFAVPGSTEELLWVKDAAREYVKLARVCKSWKKCLDANMAAVFGPLDANMNGFCYGAQGKIIPCIMWLSQHKAALGRLVVCARSADIPLLKHLLTTCDTSQLHDVRVDMMGSSMSPEFKSQWIFHTPKDVFDSKTGPNGQSLRDRFYSVAEARFDGSHKPFHDILAYTCPNIASLTIDLPYPARQQPIDSSRSFLSSALFSSAAITKLKIRVYPFSDGGGQLMDSRVITKAIKSLASLSDLSATYGRYPSSDGLLISIESSTLKTLDVSGMEMRTWVSCKCPALQQFIFIGGDCGNGSRPEMKEDQARDIDFGAYYDETNMCLRLPAARFPFRRMDVPDDCVFVAKECGYCGWDGGLFADRAYQSAASVPEHDFFYARYLRCW